MLQREEALQIQLAFWQTHPSEYSSHGELKKIGANYIQAGLWRGYAVRDGNLITGQQNFSVEETARLLLETLGR